MGIDAQMFIKTKLEVNEEKLKHWSYIFGSAFHYNLFLGSGENIYHKPLEKIEVYQQDGDDILPELNETFLEVPLSGRYYGIGYERGNLFNYIQIAEFLEKLIPNSEIWYGGDSSGVCAELFDKNKRDELTNHFINNGKDPYNRYFDRENDGPNCPICEVKMVRNGWGNNYKAFSCIGCGWQHSEKNGIITKGFN